MSHTDDGILQLLKTQQIESVSVNQSGMSIAFEENICIRIQYLDRFGYPQPLKISTFIKILD